ncbi:phytanoyl-CoA dioxygenase family protein, partial [Candidatus Poribacteria bacterium]|nr:phytanoyl-CoA dioxygenase family protein [Candidatus Poribacteria bacterium]
MRTELPSEQIAAYQENGFTIVEDFLTPDELEEWRAAVDETVTERGLYRPPTERAGENAGYYTRV